MKYVDMSMRMCAQNNVPKSLIQQQQKQQRHQNTPYT